MLRHVATDRVRRFEAMVAAVVGLDWDDSAAEATAGCNDVVDAGAGGADDVVVVVVVGVVELRCVNIFSRKYCNGCVGVRAGAPRFCVRAANRIRSGQQLGGDDTGEAATTTQRHHFIGPKQQMRV